MNTSNITGSRPWGGTYVDTSNIRNFTQRLQQVRQANILDIYREFYRYYRQKTRARYLKAATLTPYAPSSIGRKKRNGQIIGPGSLFGIDTTAMFSDYTQNVKIDDSGLRVWSNQFYAGYVESLFEKKGPFAPKGVLFATEEDLDTLEFIMEKELLEALESVLGNL